MAVTSFIPELWSARLLNALDKAHVATNFANRDYEGEIREKGDTVHINTITNPTIRTYTAGTAITTEDVTTTDTTLVIDQQKYFSFKVQDLDKVQSAGDFVDKATTQAGYGLNDVADSYLFGVIAGGVNSANVIGSSSAIGLTASNIYTNIVGMRLILDKNNVPTSGRRIALPPEAYALLLQDERFTKVGAQSEDVVRTGLVGYVAGFEVYETNNCPTATVGSATATKLIASVPTATTYAEQIVSVEAMRMESQFADLVRGQHVYGAKVTDGKAICVLNATF